MDEIENSDLNRIWFVFHLSAVKVTHDDDCGNFISENLSSRSCQFGVPSRSRKLIVPWEQSLSSKSTSSILRSSFYNSCRFVEDCFCDQKRLRY